MGIAVSIEHSLKPEGYSGKAIMCFSYDVNTKSFKTISFMDFIDSPSDFTKSPFIIIEPTHGTKPPTDKNNNKAEESPPSISYVEKSQVLHSTYKISQFKFASFRLWILVSNSISSTHISECITECRTYPFNDFFSTKAKLADDIFYDIANVSSFAAAFKPPSQSSTFRLSSPLRTTAQLNSNTLIVRRSHEAVALQTAFGNQKKIDFNFNLNNNNNAELTANPISKSNDCDFVISGLFIGGEAAARNKSLLLRLGITHIVNLNSGDSVVDEYEEFQYFPVILNDSVFEDLNRDFWNAVKFIDCAVKHKGTVLVHCRRGISRSAALCVAYLMDHRGMSLDSAMGLVKKQRPTVNINQGFREQLKEHEDHLTQKPPKTPRYGLNLTVFT